MKKKLILKLLLLFGPFTAALLWLEWRLNHVDTSYALKWRYMNAQAPNLEVLILGASLGYYGIDPALLACKGYNMGEHSQSAYYDLQVLKRFRHRLPNLKLVIMPIVYSQMGSDGSDIDPWRAWFYSQFYGISPDAPNAWEWFKSRMDPIFFSKIALFGERTKLIIRHKFLMSDEGVSELGFHPSDLPPSPIPADEIQKAKDAAVYHNKTNHFDYNEKLLQQIIDVTKEMGAELLLIEVPMSPMYTDFIDPANYGRMEAALDRLKAKNGVKHFNYTYDKRFVQADYTLPVDHLNYLGAAKFTRILNQEVLASMLKGKCGGL